MYIQVFFKVSFIINFVVLFETGSHRVVMTGLELGWPLTHIHLPLPPEWVTMLSYYYFLKSKCVCNYKYTF